MLEGYEFLVQSHQTHNLEHLSFEFEWKCAKNETIYQTNTQAMQHRQDFDSDTS